MASRTASHTASRMAHELDRWQKIPGKHFEAPWKFFANLNVNDPDSMRRVAEHLDCSFFGESVDDIESRMAAAEIHEVRRMIGETGSDRLIRNLGRSEGRARKTNRLLYSILEWFGDSWQAPDQRVVGIAMFVNDFVTLYVREPALYSAEHAAAQAQWDSFQSPDDQDEERDSDAQIQAERSGSNYTEDDGEVPAQNNEPEDMDDPREQRVAEGGGSTAANSWSNTPPRSADRYYGEEDRKDASALDSAIISRLNTTQIDTEARRTVSRDKQGRTENNPNGTMGKVASIMDGLRRNNSSTGSVGDESTESILTDDMRSNASFDQTLQAGRGFESSSTADASIGQTTPGDRRRILPIRSPHHLQLTSTAKADASSPHSPANSEAETVIMTPRRPGRPRRNSADLQNSGRTNSSSPASLNIFLETTLPKEGRTTRSGVPYNLWTGDVVNDPSLRLDPPSPSSGRDATSGNLSRGRARGRGGRPRGSGTGRRKAKKRPVTEGA